MGRRCLLCNRKQEASESYKSFHSFPTDEEQREKWIDIIGRDRLKHVVLKHAIICGDHFDRECLDQQYGRVQLKKGSLPKIITEEVNTIGQKETVKPIKIAMKNRNADHQAASHLKNTKRPPMILECFTTLPHGTRDMKSASSKGTPEVIQILVPCQKKKENSFSNMEDAACHSKVDCYAHVIEVETVDLPHMKQELQSQYHDESSPPEDMLTVDQVRRMFEEHCYEGTAAASEHIQNFLELEKEGGIITRGGAASVVEECNKIEPLCRICACANDRLINIFSQKGWKQQVLNKIHTHLPITVTGQDTLPSYICPDCLEQLNSWHSFVVSCIQADTQLKRIYGLEEYVHADNEHIDSIKEYTVKDVSDIMALFWQSKLNINKSPTSPAVSAENEVIDCSDDDDNDVNINGAEIEVIHPEFSNDEDAIQLNTDTMNPETENEIVRLDLRRKTMSTHSNFDKKKKVVELDVDIEQVEGTQGKEAMDKLLMTGDKKGESSKRLLYRCEACDVIFSSSDQLVSHQIYVHNIKIFSCSSCNIVFNASEVSFTQHMSTCRKENLNDISSLNLKVSKSQKLPSEEIELLFSHLTSQECGSEELATLQNISEECDPQEINKRNLSLLDTVNDNLDENSKKIEVTKIVISKDNVIKNASTITVCKEKGKFVQVKKESLRLREMGKNYSHRFICSLCRKKFKTKRQFTLHCLTRHKDVEFVKCIEPKYYPCSLCGKNFLYRKSLVRHKEGFCASIKKDISCDICGKKFRHKNNLDLHQIRYHTKGKRFLCDFCGKEFKRKKAFIYHLEIHEDKDYVCEICGKTVKHISQHRMSHFKNKRLFTCCICEKTVESKASLKAHMLAHSGVRNFKCPECPKSFYGKTNYNQHLLQHDAVPRFKCNYCDKRFRRKNRLTIHTKTHLQDPVFTCTVCLASFKSRKDLFSHRRQHTREEIEQNKSGNKTLGSKTKLNNAKDKNYSCKICGKEMRHSSLRLHQLTHTGEKPHRCPHCDACFKYKSSLQVHLYHHSGERPFTCDICDKKFRSQMILDQHSKIHSAERPFACTVCDASFKRRHTLGTHMRVHTGERPYPCRICDRAFKQCSDRHKHEELHYKKGDVGNIFKQCLTIEISGNADNIESQLSDNTDNTEMQISDDPVFTEVL